MGMGEINTGMLKYKDIVAPEYKNRRLRINKTSDENTFFVSRFNGNCEIKKLNGPISFIAKDENFTSNFVKAQANENFHWLLKHSGNEKAKINTRSYTSKKCNLDTDVFFMLVENEDYSDLYPISSWHVFEPDLSEKTLNKLNTTGSNAQWKREKSEKEKKLDEILERLKQKEESEKPIAKRAQDVHWGERKKRESVSDGEDDEEEEDNIPVEKQDKKKIKNLVKLKRGDDKDEIDYVNSALSITAVRKNMVDWDYSDDGKKSDDEDLNDAGFPPDELEDEEENDNSEDDENNAESNLTCYGQAVQTLLKQQINDEEDDELDQYSDDEEEEEEEEESKEKIEKEQGKSKKRKRKEISPVEKRETAKRLKMQKEKLRKRKKHDEDSSDEDSDNDEEQDDSDDDDDDSDSEEDSDEDSDGESEEDSEDNEENEKESEEEKEKEKEKKRKQPVKTDENTFNEVTREKFRKNKIQITKENCAKIIYTIIEKNNGKMEISLLLNILNIKEKNQSFILLQKAIKTLCNISSQMKDNKKVKMVAIKPKYLKK